jgi:hypothetical protein
LTLLPRAFSRVCWLPFLSCTWARFRFLFHEILGQENLPTLVWQVWDHYHFKAGKKLGENIEFNSLLSEIRMLRRREMKGLGHIS